MGAVHDHACWCRSSLCYFLGVRASCIDLAATAERQLSSSNRDCMAQWPASDITGMRLRSVCASHALSTHRLQDVVIPTAAYDELVVEWPAPLAQFQDDFLSSDLPMPSALSTLIPRNMSLVSSALVSFSLASG